MEIGKSIKHIDLAFRRNGDRMLEKYGLTLSQWNVIRFLFCQMDQGREVIQRDIEAALRLSNATVSGTLDRLEKNGFIQRRPDPENRRVNHIVLAQRALDMKQDSRRDMDEFVRRLLSPLTEEEQATLDSLLRRILEGLPQ